MARALPKEGGKMKKKFGLFALVLGLLLACSLFLFAACGDGDEQTGDEVTISVTVNGAAQTNGGTYNATVGTEYTIAATASDDSEVEVRYVFGDAAAVEVTDGKFTPQTAGDYAFTFTAEGAENFTLTVKAAAQTEPPKHTHVWDTEWTIAAPTETKAGKASRECVASGCADPATVQELELPALGNEEAKTFYKVTVKTPATCTTAEVSTYTWVKNNTVTFDVTGEVSYAQSAHTALTYVAAKAATCTEAGTIAHAHCSACGNYYTVTGDASSYTIGEEIADGESGLTNEEDLAKGHSYAVTFDSEEEYTTALGTSEGQYPVQCANCTEKVTIPLPALTAGNTWTKSDEVSATCTAAGTATFTAEVNDVTVVVKGVQTDPATGHSYTATLSFYGDIQQADQPFSVTCSSCEATKQITIGFVDQEAWQWEPETVTEATCTTPGEGKVTLTVTHEGNSYTVYLTDIAIDPLGHDYAVAYENNTVTATCGRDGCGSVVTATVTIDGNEATGGSTALDASAFSVEGDTVTVTLPENGFEREGYTFKGWGQEADGASGVRQPDDSYSVEVNGTLTIYAVWTNAPVISLEVKLGGADGTPISIPNGATIGNNYAGTGTDWVCVGTKVAYTASVTGGGAVSVSYSYSKDDSGGEPTPLEATNDAFVFENAGTYVFTISADVAEEDYTFTVIVTEHVYGEWRVATQPTAETEGELQRDCLHCAIGQTEASMQTVRMPAVTEQNIGDEDGQYSAAVTAPGCETEGKTEYSFNYDGQKFPVDYEVTTPAAGHTYGKWEVVEVPSAEANGKIERTCSVCEESTLAHTQSVTLPKLPEDTDQNYFVYLDKEASCTEEGSKRYVYRISETHGGGQIEVTTVTVPATGHVYDGRPYVSDGAGGHHQVCSVCSESGETVAHELTWVTTDETNHWQKCSHCDYTTSPEAHSYGVAYADGVVSYRCETCSAIKASANVTVTVTGGTGTVSAEAFSWGEEEFVLDLAQIEVGGLAADVKVVYYRIAGVLYDTDETYAFTESVSVEAVLEDTQATFGGTGIHWNETAWSSVLKKGDAMTVTGQLDSLAAATWQGVFVQVYSTETVVGAFRIDRYVNGEEGVVGTPYSTGENFVWTKDGTYADFNPNMKFIKLINDCTLRITIDWTDPALIEITLNFTGLVDGVNTLQTVCYTIAAKPDTQLKDSYKIGLGYEEATYVISSVERCNGKHAATELFCPVCNELNKTALDAAATNTATWENGVALGSDAFVMKATVTGNDAYGVFYELITQVDGDFTSEDSPKGYVDVHASNVQDVGLETEAAYFNAWGGGNNSFDSAANKQIAQHGTRPANAQAWSGGVYTIYAFRDTQGNGMLYVEYAKDGATYGAGVYLENWAQNVPVRFTAVGAMTEGASVTVLTGAYLAA